jgi:hypothetical protein
LLIIERRGALEMRREFLFIPGVRQDIPIRIDRQDCRGGGALNDRHSFVKSPRGFPAVAPSDKHMADRLFQIAARRNEEETAAAAEKHCFDQTGPARLPVCVA